MVVIGLLPDQGFSEFTLKKIVLINVFVFSLKDNTTVAEYLFFSLKNYCGCMKKFVFKYEKSESI